MSLILRIPAEAVYESEARFFQEFIKSTDIDSRPERYGHERLNRWFLESSTNLLVVGDQTSADFVDLMGASAPPYQASGRVEKKLP